MLRGNETRAELVRLLDAEAAESETRPDVLLDPFCEVAELNPRFFALLRRMAVLHNVKQHDYCGQGIDPLANLRASAALGIPAWKGCLVRMGDKWQRLTNFARQEALAVKDESFTDTCLDLAVYALHEIILYNQTVEGDVEPQCDRRGNKH